MTKATQNPPTTSTAAPAPPNEKTEADHAWTLSDVESLLIDLQTEIGILGHIGNSSDEIEGDQVILIKSGLLDLHASLREIWESAWNRSCAESQEAREALEAAKAEQAAPGSRADLKHAESCWNLLHAAGTVVLDECSKRLAPVAESPDAELISLCDRLVAISAAEVAMCEAIEDDRERDKAEKPLSAEWHKIHTRLLEIGRPKTQAGAAAAARAAPLNLNVNEDGSPMSGELGMWLCLAVCAYLTDDPAPFWRAAHE